MSLHDRKDHTAGPWWFDPDNRTVQQGNPVMGPRICTVHGTGDDYEANARLIAAAPDLIAALDGLLDAADYVKHFDLSRGEQIRKLVPALQSARAAIAKATQGQS